MTKKSANLAKPVTPQDAARMQSSVAKVTNGKIPKGNYVGRIQRAAAKNQPDKSGQEVRLRGGDACPRNLMTTTTATS